MNEKRENLIKKMNSGSTSHVPMEIWEELKKIRNTRDMYSGRTPTREEIQEILLNNYGYQVSLKTIERRLPLKNINFPFTRKQLINKLSNYYTKPQIDQFINIVKYSQSRLNENVVKFIRLKLEFEIAEQDKPFNDRFPYDPVQQSWIDLYVSLDVIGEWIGAEKECSEIKNLIEKYRPWYFKDPKEFGYDISSQDWLNMGKIEKFKTIISGLKASMKMASDKEFSDVLNRKKDYMKEARIPAQILIQKLRDRAYANSIATPVSMMKENDFATWVEELIGRLPEPTRPTKELLNMRNEIASKREMKRTPEDYILWNVLIKIFEQAESEV